MVTSIHAKRVIQVFRYDPTKGGNGYFDRFELDIADPNSTTMLDILIRIQREKDPSVAFRYACRVNMCGSCAMVINGRERLACKTNVCDLPPDQDIILRPLNHFPVVKDLVVDMTPFFKKYEEALPYFSPKQIQSEPATIPPDATERKDIGLATECIQCGGCVSSCTMVNYHDGYAGPAALNRAFTLLADSREGRNPERLRAVLESCYSCRTEFNCTEVCPKELSPTRAIKFIQRLALKQIGGLIKPEENPEDVRDTFPPVPAAVPELPGDPSRRRFFSRITIGVGAVCALGVGGVIAATAIGPALTRTPERWIAVCPMNDLPAGQISTLPISYEVTSGFHKETVVKQVMISRKADVNSLVVYNATCPHLGCMVHWDAGKNIFLCACHGGQFNQDGQVIAGPPPRPLDTHRFRVENGYLMVEVA